MREKRKLIRWIKEHKKALIIAGVSITTLIAIVLGIKNREAIKELWASLHVTAEKPVASAAMIQQAEETTSVLENVAKVTSQHHETFLFDVRKHIRNLHEGQHASPEKIATALENGFELAEGQTWVIDFTKGEAA